VVETNDEERYVVHREYPDATIADKNVGREAPETGIRSLTGNINPAGKEMNYTDDILARATVVSGTCQVVV
jgi:hypothetical protein